MIRSRFCRRRRSTLLLDLDNISTVEPRLPGPGLSGLFDYPDFFLWSQFFHEYQLVVIAKTQSRKKPNNPFKRLLKQRIILCAFQNSHVRRDKEVF